MAKDYTITWDGTNVSAITGGTSSFTSTTDFLQPVEPFYDILEDGPWSPLYEYEDYVGIAHAILAEELGLDKEVKC